MTTINLDQLLLHEVYELAETTDDLDLLRTLAYDYEHPNDLFNDIKVCLASNENTPLDILVELATPMSDDMDDDEEWFPVRAAVASNPATPLDILAVLATDEGWYVRAEVAKNPKTTPEMLDSMASKYADKPEIDTVIATNEKTTVSTLARLVSGFSNTRMAVVSNPNATAEILDECRMDGFDIDLQLAVISHQNVHPVTLARIAKLAIVGEVLTPIAENPKTDNKTLNVLSSHYNGAVSNAAVANLRTK